MLEISNPTKPIKVIGILPYQSEHFLRLGFKPMEIRRIMIRPTEKLEMVDWREHLIIKSPTVESIEEIAQLSYKSYLGTDCIGYPSINTIEQQMEDLDYYFKNNNEDFLRKSSCLVFDKTNNNLVGACLISMWEEIPLISNIVVEPKYRGQGIASNLLRHCLTVLNDKYDVVRLFVTVGNPAESMYYNMGFLPGMEQISYTLPIKNTSV
ncbi:GNAT family N-acetyltransferase [Bacillus sp. FJAT-27245]|uniref:GNAT family N-acetyltransferase n=1 Tax=Bacillus sp. FJAT-27245 TaxID=1684144 RepID=UPI0006A7EEDC|nr:GNAT family N-acetyltransferase [Bacillus sp. FJAT-27245]